MNRYLAKAFAMAKPNTTAKEIQELADQFQLFYNIGLIDAANKAHQWGNESCGGSGDGGKGYHNLAQSILAMRETEK